MSIPEIEKKILEFWKENKIFEKSLKKKSPKGNFVFYEGPPTANGKPGIHHVEARAFKDVIPRYKTMQGYHVERKAGWDTHGLPVELEVEKALELKNKKDIENYGIEKFNRKCKESVWKYKEEWEKMTERMGYWIDMENPYITYNNSYIESLWWIIKQIYDKGLIYKGYKVVPQCPRCGTALSSHEVAQGYRSVKEKSIYIKFKLKNRNNEYILAWTTTPWTLPGNIALAIGEKIEYVKIKHNNEFYYLAKNLLDKINGEYKIVEELRGKEMIGWEYEPLFGGVIKGDEKNAENAFKIYPANFVSTEDGTGIVHTAVMYGVDDYELGEKIGLPKIHTVNFDGTFNELVPQWKGKFVKDAEKEIIEELEDRNILYNTEEYVHDYPFCWRCDSPLIYYARDSWYFEMSKLREKLIKNNEKINWVPEHIKEGRFGEWLRDVKDWAISRERYWGTPIPIWICEKCKEMKVIASRKELGVDDKFDLHKPFIDEIKFKCKCGGEMKRTPEVMDCWFDSGAMPFAQYHYPFENKNFIDRKEQFPADFISEAVDQTRGWFYTLLAISTMLGKESPYKNVICLGHILDKDGQKMSKHIGNVIDPILMIEKYGADVVRWYIYSVNQPGEPKRFSEDALKESGSMFNTLLNVLSFYKMFEDGVEIENLNKDKDSEEDDEFGDLEIGDEIEDEEPEISDKEDKARDARENPDEKPEKKSKSEKSKEKEKDEKPEKKDKDKKEDVQTEAYDIPDFVHGIAGYKIRKTLVGLEPGRARSIEGADWAKIRVRHDGVAELIVRSPNGMLPYEVVARFKEETEESMTEAYGVRWSEENIDEGIIVKQAFFKTSDARAHFIRELMESPDFREILDYPEDITKDASNMSSGEQPAGELELPDNIDDRGGDASKHWESMTESKLADAWARGEVLFDYGILHAVMDRGENGISEDILIRMLQTYHGADKTSVGKRIASLITNGCLVRRGDNLHITADKGEPLEAKLAESVKAKPLVEVKLEENTEVIYHVKPGLEFSSGTDHSVAPRRYMAPLALPDGLAEAMLYGLLDPREAIVKLADCAIDAKIADELQHMEFSK